MNQKGFPSFSAYIQYRKREAAEPPCIVTNGPRIYRYSKPQQVEDRFTKQNTKNIKMVKKTDVQGMHPLGIVIIHDSLPSCTVAAMEDSTWSI